MCSLFMLRKKLSSLPAWLMIMETYTVSFLSAKSSLILSFFLSILCIAIHTSKPLEDWNEIYIFDMFLKCPKNYSPLVSIP